MRRLAIDSFPSLFLIEGSLTRRYLGIRAQEQVCLMCCMLATMRPCLPAIHCQYYCGIANYST